MALFTSIDQVSKPTTANNKTPKRQFDIEYHNEEFPYIIINNVFDTEEKKRLIWEELDFLCYDWKDLSYLNKNSTGGWDRDTNITSRKEMFLEAIYANPMMCSILKVYNDTFNYDYKDFYDILNGHDHWFFKEALILHRSYLLNYYENRNFYKPHRDQGLMTCLHWMFRDPKKFEGGEFIFPDFDKKIEVENNKMIIFPSMLRHEVTPIVMKDEDMNKKLGRWCITTFHGSNDHPERKSPH